MLEKVEKVDLKAENERLKKEIQNKNFNIQLLSALLDYKNKEFINIASSNFINYQYIVNIAQEQAYGNNELKIRKIEEIARERRDYYERLAFDAQKNRTNITNHSNK